MNARGVVVGVLAGLVLTGCVISTGGASRDETLSLPVGSTEWDVTAPAWFHEGVLHVGERTLELGDDVDEFVLGATGVYWMNAQTFMFTSAEGDTQEVGDLGTSDLAVSADRSVLAVVDQTRGPTDKFGAHVAQVAAFDTRTGEQLYRTPDKEPSAGADLTDLYEETSPLLLGVSNERIFFDHTTVNLDDGSIAPVRLTPDRNIIFRGYEETLFLDGYHVSKAPDFLKHGATLLSPDRSAYFDLGRWPAGAFVYDAETGHKARIDVPWHHFTLAGWSDDTTFFGVALRSDPESGARTRQVVTCELRSLACTTVSPVLADEDSDQDPASIFLVEGNSSPL